MQNDIVRRPTQPALNRVHEQPNTRDQPSSQEIIPDAPAPEAPIETAEPVIAQHSAARPIGIIAGALLVCAALMGLTIYGALNPEPAVELSNASRSNQADAADQSLSKAPVVR